MTDRPTIYLNEPDEEPAKGRPIIDLRSNYPDGLTHSERKAKQEREAKQERQRPTLYLNGAEEKPSSGTKLTPEHGTSLGKFIAGMITDAVTSRQGPALRPHMASEQFSQYWKSADQ